MGLALVLLGLCACSEEDAAAPKRFTHGIVRIDDLPMHWASLPFARIEFEREADAYALMWGERKAIYSLCLYRGEDGEQAGEAWATGILPTGARGHFAGEVGIRDYASLCWLLEELGLEDFEQSYPHGPTHADWVTLRVYREYDGPPIEVHEYAGTGPIALWAIHRCIDSIVIAIEWEKVAKPDPNLATIRDSDSPQWQPK